MEPHTSLPRFVAMRHVKRALGDVAYATINEMIADGQLPKPIRIRRGVVLFPEEPLLDAMRWLGDAA